MVHGLWLPLESLFWLRMRSQLATNKPCCRLLFVVRCSLYVVLYSLSMLASSSRWIVAWENSTDPQNFNFLSGIVQFYNQTANKHSNNNNNNNTNSSSEKFHKPFGHFPQCLFVAFWCGLSLKLGYWCHRLSAILSDHKKQRCDLQHHQNLPHKMSSRQAIKSTLDALTTVLKRQTIWPNLLFVYK